MSGTRCVLAVIVGTIVLFLWNALTQFFPWGVGVVNQLSSTSGEAYVIDVPRLEEAPPGTWTTPAFEDRLGDGVSTLATDRSFSWIVAIPRADYNFARYFAYHTVVQCGVALFLVLVIWLLQPLSRMRRLTAVLFLGVAGMLASYGTLMVWWGLPAGYGVGSAVNVLVGWFLVLLVVDRLTSGKRRAS